MDFSKLPLGIQVVLTGLDLGGTLSRCVTEYLPNHRLALKLWAEKVKDKAEWDHKPKIETRFPSRLPYVHREHLYGDCLYKYDIWSNIHYGYVGTAAGFPEWELVRGAGVAHILTKLKNAKSDEEVIAIIRKKFGDDPSSVFNLRTWDNPKDRAAIELGIRLYRIRPKRVTKEDEMSEIRFSRNSLAVRPYHGPEP